MGRYLDMENKIIKIVEKIGISIFDKLDILKKKADRIEEYMFEVSNQLNNNEQVFFEGYDQIDHRLLLIENKLNELITRVSMSDTMYLYDNLKTTVKQ
jgi:hypothetical protein